MTNTLFEVAQHRAIFLLNLDNVHNLSLVFVDEFLQVDELRIKFIYVLMRLLFRSCGHIGGE
jgi:hypothetical protein